MKENKEISDMFLRAVSFHQQGNLNEAETLYRTILSSNPRHYDALSLLGMIHLQRGQHEEGVRLIGRSLDINSRQPIALNNRGNALNSLGRHAEALASFDKVIMLDPGVAEAHNNRGNALNNLGRHAEALASYDKAIALKPGFAEAHNNRGNILNSLGRCAEALASFDQAIAINPGFAEAHYARGNALHRLERQDEALASYERAVAIKPDYAEAHYNRGVLLQHFDRQNEALMSYDRVLALRPDYAEAHYNRGIALQRQKRPDEAFMSFERALELKRDFPYLGNSWLHCKMLCCSWEGLDDACTDVIAAVERGEKASTPFALLPIPSTLAQQQRCARATVGDLHPGSPSPIWRGERYAHDRIRIGYFSADFHNHATAHLMAGLFECHDRARFEIVGFSFGSAVSDKWRQRLERAFDRFFDASGLSDRETAELARGQEIDIAIDLKGHTYDARPGIFALRPAPVQVNYLGYPGTLGADYMDYLIADTVVIPPEHRQYYDEKIVYLPHCYQVNDSTKTISSRSFSRAELGLPERAFVFCCFNNNYKITPDVFDIWMRLLEKIPDSTLWLLEGNATAARNLRHEAEKRGVPSGRLVFAPRMELPDHLARHRQADLFLDTFYYNAHTTASDALWAGLPVLTCLGEAFAGRVAASLLRAVGLPELITTSHEEYEARALELATHPDRLAALREKLAVNRNTQPLFDTVGFARDIERAYRLMHERHQAGLGADHFGVEG